MAPADPWELLRQPATVSISKSYPEDMRNIIATFKVSERDLAGLLAWMCAVPDDGPSGQ